MSFFSTIGKVFKTVLPFVNPIASVAAPVIGSLIGAKSAKDTNKAQIEQSNQLFDKQKTETDTAHQREIADLAAAGLNPILSSKYGGSASATGAMPNLKTPFENAGRDFSSAAQIALNRRMTTAQIQTEKTKQNLNSASALKSMADAIGQRYRNRKAGASLGSYENSFYKNILAPAQRFKESVNPLSNINLSK